MNDSFLAKRGVREDIVTFDVRNITHEIRQSVEELLHRNKASFDPKVRHTHLNEHTATKLNFTLHTETYFILKLSLFTMNLKNGQTHGILISLFNAV